MPFGEISPIAIIIAVFFNMFLGAIWYSPQVLGSIWASSQHLNQDVLKPSIGSYLGTFAISLVTVWVLAIFFQLLSVVTIAEGIIVAFFLWLGFIATTHLSGVIWTNKTFKAYLIDTSFQLVSLLISAIILTLWG